MNSDCKTMKTTIKGFLCLGLVATFVAGCASQPKPEGHDYRQTHKIRVAREQVSVSVVLPLQGTRLSPGDQRRFKTFMRDFVQRGRTSVTVESATPQVARDILLANGLRENEIIIAPNTTVAAPNAILSFTANVAVSPECGDWTASPTLNPSNAPHSNFGCATQRNVGQIVADPGDFIQAQPATGGAAKRSDAAIRTLNSAPVAGAPAAAGATP